MDTLLNNSAFPVWLNITATIPPLLFFAMAIVHYAQPGISTESNNSLLDSADKIKDYRILNTLAVAEISGFSILFVGFLVRLWT